MNTSSRTDLRSNASFSVTKGRGPEFAPTHPFALAPAGTPPVSVDGFTKEFLRELNTGQGVTLSEATENDL